jgi:hypothetical protein
MLPTADMLHSIPFPGVLDVGMLTVEPKRLGCFLIWTNYITFIFLSFYLLINCSLNVQRQTAPRCSKLPAPPPIGISDRTGRLFPSTDGVDYIEVDWILMYPNTNEDNARL